MALVGTVVVHHPDFLGAAARADEGDLCCGHAGKAAGELGDDFVGELMGEFADLEIRGRAAINLSDDGLRSWIADVVEPSFDGDFRGGFGEIAKAKEIRDDGSIVEIVIWELPVPLTPSTHRYKYRLYYGATGMARVRYDNERGKGDHRHLGEREEDYLFTTLEQLLADFEQDINDWSSS